MFGDRPLCISLETAHPAKFPDEIRELLGINPDLPPSMADIDRRSGEPAFLSADYGELRIFLQKNLQSRG